MLKIVGGQVLLCNLQERGIMQIATHDQPQVSVRYLHKGHKSTRGKGHQNGVPLLVELGRV